MTVTNYDRFVGRILFKSDEQDMLYAEDRNGCLRELRLSSRVQTEALREGDLVDVWLQQIEDRPPPPLVVPPTVIAIFKLDPTDWIVLGQAVDMQKEYRMGQSKKKL